MNDIFTNILHASFHGSVIILLVIAARLLLRKAPRSTICLLWVMAGLRLLMPFQIESPISLQPEIPPVVSQMEAQSPAPVLPDIQPDSAVVPDQLPPDVTITYDDNAVSAPVIHVFDYDAIAIGIWLTVACGLVGYTVISYGLLKRKVGGSTLAEDGVYESTAIDSPFLLGYVKPAIFLPAKLPDADRPYILAHERGHMDRGDNWIKLIGFLCVALHWFNPLVWLGYHLLCKDIEMACDEHVVKHMDLASRKGYSAALVNCSTTRHFGACPVAFGEVSVKQRVLSVLHYRKPGFWISLACLAVVGFVATCFLTNPTSQPEETLPGDSIPNEHAQIIEQCKSAYLQTFGSQTYHIQVDTQYQSQSGIMDYSTKTTFLRNGDDWFRQGIVHEQNFDKTVVELGYGGTVLKRSKNDASPTEKWTLTNDSAELHTPWTVEIDWNRLTYHETDAASGSRGHSFLLDGNEDNVITFCLSYGGSLTAILHRFDLVTPMDTISYVTVECKLISSQAEEISSDILDTYHQAILEIAPAESPKVTQLLQKCQDAIEMFQRAQDYFVYVHFESNDPAVLSDDYFCDYWRSGADYLQNERMPDAQDLCLYVNGKYFRKTISKAIRQQDPHYANWTPVEQPEVHFTGRPWVMNVRWEDADISFLGSDSIATEEVITVAVNDPNAAYPYRLTFRFGKESGKLNSIRMWHTYESAGATYTSSATIEGYSFDKDDVNITIQKYYQEAQLQTIPDEID